MLFIVAYFPCDISTFTAGRRVVVRASSCAMVQHPLLDSCGAIAVSCCRIIVLVLVSLLSLLSIGFLLALALNYHWCAGCGLSLQIIFSSKKRNCDKLAQAAWDRGFAVDSLHGDREQWERTKVGIYGPMCRT